MRIFRTNSATKNTKHYAFTQKFPLTSYSGKHHDWPPATYFCRYRHPVQRRLPELGGMDDLRKRFEKTPPPPPLSGKPFKRPFGIKINPPWFIFVFQTAFIFFRRPLETRGGKQCKQWMKIKIRPAVLPIEKQRQSKHLVFIRTQSFQTTSCHRFPTPVQSSPHAKHPSPDFS